MNLKPPSTTEERKAGMKSFRAKMLATHERLANDPKLSEKDRAYQLELVSSIKRAQQKYGEA